MELKLISTLLQFFFFLPREWLFGVLYGPKQQFFSAWAAASRPV